MILVLIGYIILGFIIGTLAGVILGQLSVWRHLRKKRVVRIIDWEYTAIPVIELEK